MIKACGVAAVPRRHRRARARSSWPWCAAPTPTPCIRGIDTSAAEAMPGVVGVMTAQGHQGHQPPEATSSADRPVLCEDRVRDIGDPVAVVAADDPRAGRGRGRGRRGRVRAAAGARLARRGDGRGRAPAPRRAAERLPDPAADQGRRRQGACRTRPRSSRPASTPRSTTRRRWSPRPASPTSRARATTRSWSSSAAASTSTSTWPCCRRRSAGRTCATRRPSRAASSASRSRSPPRASPAAAALHFRRPVRYIPSLTESMQLTPKRHPFDMQLKLGADADGPPHRPSQMDMLVDNGAYISNGQVVMLRVAARCSRARTTSPTSTRSRKLVYTNNPWGGRRARRRAAAGQLRARVRHGHAGPQDGHRPARVPAAQLAASGPDQVHGAGRWRSGRSRSSATRSSPTTSGPSARRAERRDRHRADGASAWAPARSASAARAIRRSSRSSSTPTTA